MHRLTVPTLAAALLMALPAFAGTAKFDAQMKPLYEQYLVIQDALSKDTTQGVKAAAQKIAAQAKRLDPSTVTGEHAAHFKMLPKNIREGALAVAGAKDLASAREAFKALSRPVAMWAQMSKPEGAYVMFCSMAKSSWVQTGADVRNPYYGQSMLTCGETISAPEGAAAAKGGHDMKDMKGMKGHQMN